MAKLTTFFVVLIFSTLVSCRFLETLTSGLKLTEALLKTEKVNKLVTEAFKNVPKNNYKHPLSPMNFFLTSFLKVLGLDVTKITAIAINGMIFMAQMLGSSLTTSLSYNPELAEVKTISSENPIDWLLENHEIAQLTSHLTDKKLPEYAIEYVKENSLDTDETGCVQLLICKISPFIWSMQKAVTSTRANATTTPFNGIPLMFEYLPDKSDLLRQSGICEENYGTICTF